MTTNLIKVKNVNTREVSTIIRLSESLFMDTDKITVYLTKSTVDVNKEANFIYDNATYVPVYYTIVATLSAMEFNKATEVFIRNIE